MLDRRILKIEKKLAKHGSFLPQEVGRCEIWIDGFQRKHCYKQRSPQRKMQSNFHPNEWVQYTSQLQYVV
jgi:hypothetical protein